MERQSLVGNTLEPMRTCRPSSGSVLGTARALTLAYVEDIIAISRLRPTRRLRQRYVKMSKIKWNLLVIWQEHLCWHANPPFVFTILDYFGGIDYTKRINVQSTNSPPNQNTRKPILKTKTNASICCSKILVLRVTPLVYYTFIWMHANARITKITWDLSTNNFGIQNFYTF